MDAWAQLVCVTDAESPPVEIDKDKFTVGRARDNDLSLFENKLVSGHHCYLERDDQCNVWLYDTSTNGTLLNMAEKLAKGECRQLQHGDEFFVVYKKNNTELNVGYMYQDLSELAKEAESDPHETQEYDDVTNNADATLYDEELNLAASPEVKKRPHSEDSETSEPVAKKQKSEEKTAIPDSTSKSKDSSDSTSQSKDSSDSTSQSKGKVEDKKEETIVSEKSVDTKTEEEKQEGSSAAAEKKDVDESDAMAETLLCIICQEILHDCISLQPCMHSFCAGCYSEWMERSNECPSCRLKVERINKNHIVNNLVEAYLKEHPDRKRPEDDIKDLDVKNKITRDMLYPKNTRRDSDEESSENYTDSDDLEPPRSISPVAPNMSVFGTGNWLGGLGLFGATRPPKTVCRQCADYKEPNTDTGIIGGIKTAITTVKDMVTGTDGAGTAGGNNPVTSGGDNPVTTGDGAGPSTSGGDGDGGLADDKVMPTPPQFTCALNQNHVLCQCCMQPMPDRRAERNTNPTLPPQQCLICYRAYCHAYWGCRNVNCLGCIGKFKDMNFGKKSLPQLILDNASESTIFKDYLEDNNISVREVLRDSLVKLEAGQYKCFDQMRFRIDGNTVFCYACGMRNFKDLAYQYRKDIPQDKLPETVRKRPNCYWGKNCRTQRNKPHHAAHYNHVCDQTRTT